MPDYMYLLESRLSPEQRAVLERVQELARAQEVNVYLTGGAVRDLISGQPIRDLDFTVEGNPVKMVRELEKGGARAVWESEKIRHHEMIFAGDVDGSISAAREDYYERPGAKPEYRFSGIMEDLRRRDFGINAIAISLNTQSRGLLLDPMNGLADLEKQEVRALSIHAFTNQPIRLMRILRYAARMGFKMESRTQEWFDLAIERGLIDRIEGGDVGHELRALAREDNPVATLKPWESHGLLALIHPSLQKRKPDYDSLNKLARVRSNLYGAGLRPRLHLAVTYYTLGRLKSREAASALRNLEYRANGDRRDRRTGSGNSESREDAEEHEDATPRRTPITTSHLCPPKCWRSSKWRCRIRARFPRFAITCRSGVRCAWRRPQRSLTRWALRAARNSTRLSNSFLRCNCAARARRRKTAPRS